ncbi:MAG: Alternative oxidase, mitochondrial precursor [Phylliscum demangeonii]|nr:MAG: Alternative oxidase, mitochondrial precursor [Phylliscum demangeonii]
MIVASRYPSTSLASRQVATAVGQAIHRATPHASRPGLAACRPLSPSATIARRLRPSSDGGRVFSSTAKSNLKECFPAPRDSAHIKTTEAAWKHPLYAVGDMKSIQIAHREAKNWSDWTALCLVRLLRWGMDRATGYRHDPAVVHGDKDARSPTAHQKYTMNERKWLVRFVFLESVAGVPGMVGGMLRHLHSLRRMKRDNGWIETLLEEAYNERMHLLTFLKMAEPGWFMRFMILAAQGIFFNSMFLSYLVSPRTCHRFVGYLEEEAVMTYTQAIADIDSGKLPRWEKLEAPDIAVRYWNMPEGHRTMKDLLLYIRADEAKHREVNHTLGNLSQKSDPNPFVSRYLDETKPHPTKGIERLRPIGWEREEVI